MSKLEEYGVEVIENVFTSEEMAQLKYEAYKLSLTPHLITLAGYPHNPMEMSGNKPALLFFPALCSTVLDRFRTDPRMVAIVKERLGDNVKQVNNQVYFREAGDKDEFAWHQDIVFREPRDRFPNVAEHYMQTIIAVDDITADNGAIEFIDGSHLHGEQHLTSNKALTKMLRKFKRHGLEGTKYEVPAGSVMLWNVLTVHGSEANVSDSDRMTYMNGFCRAEGCLDYPWYLKDGVIQKIDPCQLP